MGENQSNPMSQRSHDSKTSQQNSLPSSPIQTEKKQRNQIRQTGIANINGSKSESNFMSLRQYEQTNKRRLSSQNNKRVSRSQISMSEEVLANNRNPITSLQEGSTNSSVRLIFQRLERVRRQNPSFYSFLSRYYDSNGTKTIAQKQNNPESSQKLNQRNELQKSQIQIQNKFKFKKKIDFNSEEQVQEQAYFDELQLEQIFEEYSEKVPKCKVFQTVPPNFANLQKKQIKKRIYKKISQQSYKKCKNLMINGKQLAQQNNRLKENNKQMKGILCEWIENEKLDIRIKNQEDTFEYLQHLILSNKNNLNISLSCQQEISSLLKQLQKQKRRQKQVFLIKLQALQKKIKYKVALDITNEQALVLKFQGENKIARYHGVYEFAKGEWLRLVRLNLSGNNICDQGLIKLSQVKMPNLTYLNLELNNLKTLNNIEKFNQLQELRLNYSSNENQNQFGKKAAQNLTSVRWKNLKTLWIQFKSIHEQSQTKKYKCQQQAWQIFIEKLQAKFPALEHLWINNTSLINEQTLNLIKQKIQKINSNHNLNEKPKICLHIQKHQNTINRSI